MKRPAFLLAASLVAGTTALLAGGGDAFGRAFLSLGLPGLALPFLDDPGLRGMAQFRAGEFSAAAKSFDAAEDAYNQGLAAAWSHDYAAALAAWERHLADHPGDRQAEANYALVTELFAGLEFDPVAVPQAEPREGPEMAAETGEGTARASSTGAEATNTQAGFAMPELSSSGLREVPNVFDAQYLAASERWLETLADEPGLYLKALIGAERKARAARGEALEPPEDPR
ncbi:MAG: hypothetical protein AAF415_18265 [Pseudomonadota bacterium]